MKSGAKQSSKQRKILSILESKKLMDKAVSDDRALLEAMSKRGKDKIIFAPDFSEIFGYCFFVKNDIDSYFEAKDKFHQKIKSLSLMEEMFFHISPLLLLPSYKLELRRMINTGMESEIGDISSALGLYQRRINETDSKFRTWLLDAQKLATEATKDEHVISKIFNGVTEYAPELLLLLQYHHQHPQRRLEYILQKANLISIEDQFRTRKLDYSEKVFEFWKCELKRRRGDLGAANDIDALAVAHASFLNINYPEHPYIVLLTRSEIMKSISLVQDENVGEVSIVHPRILGTYRMSRVANISTIELLKRRHKIYTDIDMNFRKLFSEKASNILDSSIGAAKKSFKRLEENLEHIEELLLADDIIHSQENFESISIDFGEILDQAIQLLSDSNEFKNYLVNRLNNLIGDVDEVTANIATLGILQAENFSEINVRFDQNIRASKPTELPRPSIKLSIYEDTYFPYVIQVYNENIEAWFEKNSDVYYVLRKLIRSSKDSQFYEKRLALGYMLSAMHAWPVALSYFNAAISTNEEGTPPKHEAYYFRAICTRKTKSQDDYLWHCMNDLLQANSIKRDQQDAPEFWDPRYLQELGIIASEVEFEESEKFTDVLKEYGFQNPIHIWEAALNAVEEDQHTKLHILNNICFYTVTSPSLQDEQKSNLIDQYFPVFLEMVEEIDRSRVHPMILHTLYYCDYLLSEQDDLATERYCAKLAHLVPKLSEEEALQITEEIQRFIIET